MELLRRVLGRRRLGDGQKSEGFVEDDKSSDLPFIASSLFYLGVIIFVGIPMWFCTCSLTRYSLPALGTLEAKLAYSPKLHLDISVIQLSNQDQTVDDQQAAHLRDNLQPQLNTQLENITYGINWRIRRPTQDERKIFQSFQSTDISNDKDKRDKLIQLEANLLKAHKPSNRFRLFMYLVEESQYPKFCDPRRVHSYTIGFERFVYLCPSHALAPAENSQALVNLINGAVRDVYLSSIDIERVKQILSPQLDLLMSLTPQSTTLESLSSLSSLAAKLHHLYVKNVRAQHTDLAEIANIRFLTQNIVDLIDEDALANLFERPSKERSNLNTNATGSGTTRVIKVDSIGQLFHKFESRLNKHSTQNVHNVLVMLPDPNQAAISFKEDSPGSTLKILEGQDSNSILILQDDKSTVLGLRAVLRRWELDAVMGALTIMKLKSVLLSLKSMSQQLIGIRIPKDVSNIAKEAHGMALDSVQHLETKRTLEAYRLASQAYELSESAYYDPSLLETLYFPDDLKYAIYLPLFLPLALPMAYSVLRIIKFAISSIRGKKEKIN